MLNYDKFAKEHLTDDKKLVKIFPNNPAPRSKFNDVEGEKELLDEYWQCV